MTNRFTWPAYPQTTAEFESLMQAVDAALAAQGLKPFQRPLNVSRKFWEAFGWGGNVLPVRERAAEPGFEGEVLLAKAYQWYEHSYGERLKADFSYGRAPYRLANALWQVRVGWLAGTVDLFIDRNLGNEGVSIDVRSSATLNVLSAIERLPQGLAERLPEQVLREYAEFYVFLLDVFAWRAELPKQELFEMARADYESSTADLLAHRYGQARWGTQQAVEKTLKGMLSIGGTDFPRGTKGHDLAQLGALAAQRHQIQVDPALLQATACSAAVRYGEVPSTEDDAYTANHAALGIFSNLIKSTAVVGLLRAWHLTQREANDDTASHPTDRK